MKIVQAFPCRCRFADKENAPKVEEEVKFLHVEIFSWPKTYRQPVFVCQPFTFHIILKEKNSEEKMPLNYTCTKRACL